MQDAPLQPTYIRICARKSKINVGFPCHDRRYLILGLPYIGNVPNQPFSFILKAIKKTIPSYGKKGREFNFESKVTLEKLLLHYWVCIPLSFKSEHSVQPPSSSLIDGEPLCLPYMSLPLVKDWSGGGPVGRNSGSWFRTVPTQKFVMFHFYWSFINRNTPFLSNWYLENICIMIHGHAFFV